MDLDSQIEMAKVSAFIEINSVINVGPWLVVLGGSKAIFLRAKLSWGSGAFDDSA